MKAVLVSLLAVAVVSALVEPRHELEAGLWDSEGHTRARSEWRAVGRAEPDAPIRLTFAIKQQNLDQLENALLGVSDPDSSLYGQHLSRDEVDALVAPAPVALHTVKRWITSHGLQVTGGTGNEDFLFVDCLMQDAERLLGVEYWRYESLAPRTPHPVTGVTPAPVSITRARSAYTVPRSVAAHLDFVAPTIHFPRVRRARITPPPPRAEGEEEEDPKDLFVTPEFLHGLYQVPAGTRSTVPSNIQSFASFLEQYWSPSDLQEFFGLFANSSVGQTVAQSIGPNDPTNPGTEAELDVQYLMGVGSGVQTWAYYTAGRAPNPENEPFLTWLTLLASESTIPALFSVSYGEDEKSVGLDYGSRVNVEFQKVGVRGSSIMIAAGDSGAGGNCTAAGRYSPDFPSGSPWVTTVGGLIGGTAGLTPTGESADSISGGGFSDYWPAPSYQLSAIQTYFSTASSSLPPSALYNLTGRGYPDVSAQSEGFVVVQSGLPLPGVGGTSCASPSFSGVIALLNDARMAAGKSALGFLNPLIYKIAANPANANAFNDATEGSNMGCGSDSAFPAVKGWDAATGWGSPNYRLLKPIVLALP